MLDFGGTEGHGNSIGLGDLADVDAPTSYTWAFFLKPIADWTGANDEIIAKFSGANSGIIIRKFPGAGTKTMGVVHGDGAANNEVASTSNVTFSATQSWILVWTGTNLNFFKNNVADGTPALTRAIQTNAAGVTLGNRSSTDVFGAACALGHAAFWKNYQHTAGNRSDFHGGVGASPPQLADLKFWHRGTAVPGKDEISGTAGSTDGTVVLASDTVDGYWIAAGGFVMFLVEVLMPIFGATLYELQGQMGPGAFREARKMIPALNRRCAFDWTDRELEELVRRFEARPVYA